MDRKENATLVFAILKMDMLRSNGLPLTEQQILEQLTRYVPLDEARTVLTKVDISGLSAVEVGRLGVAFYNGKLNNFYSFRKHKFMLGIVFHRAHSRASWRISARDVVGRLDVAKARLTSMSAEEVDATTSEFDSQYSYQEPVFDIL